MFSFRIGYLLPFFLFLSVNGKGQDSLYTRKIINTLTSKEYHGRGYVKNGDRLAALRIREEFNRLKLLPEGNHYFQQFSFPVNTFPAAMSLITDHHQLIPGVDFIISPESNSLKGTFPVKVVNQPPSFYKDENLSNTIVLVDTTGHTDTFDAGALKNWTSSSSPAKGVIWISEKKLTWSVSIKQPSIFSAQVLRSSISTPPKAISVDVKSDFVMSHTTQNIIGKIEGVLYPDSFIYITAHYDHLGMMGDKTFFPGANDNASGVSMLLNLANYFSLPEHRPKYSIVFICFAGEEAGLLGSKYYTEHPTHPLSSIRFLLNLDLLGTGDEGMMVVNATVFNKEFSLLDSINSSHHYLPSIGKRGKAHNSDHYYFTEQNVPSFFCYTLGGITAYHDIYDKETTLPLTRYQETFRLLSTFIEAL